MPTPKKKRVKKGRTIKGYAVTLETESGINGNIEGRLSIFMTKAGAEKHANVFGKALAKLVGIEIKPVLINIIEK